MSQDFFFPHADDPDLAEEIYQAVVTFANQTMGRKVGSARIRRIEYVHEGRSYVDEVGKENVRQRETVAAILDSVPVLVCTYNRGVKRGEPILVGRDEIRHIEMFNGYEKPDWAQDR